MPLPYTPLTCDQIQSAVDKDLTLGNFKDELALKDALKELTWLPAGFARILSQTCLVDAWEVPGHQALPLEDRIRFARRVEEHGLVFADLGSLTPDQWLLDQNVMSAAIDKLAVVFPASPHTGERQLIFWTKFLHWCVSGAFPMWSPSACKALKVEIAADSGWAMYKEWAELVGEHVRSHMQCCLRQRQLPTETVIRTFDRAAYGIGSRPPGPPDENDPRFT
jgi:hypothetical protein